MPPRPSSDVRIIVAGRELSNWQSYEIESDMMQSADAFSFTVPNHSGKLSGTVKRFDDAQVYVDGALQMTGYVDDVCNTTDADGGAAMEIVGRDVFGQLVDCSAEPATHHNVDLKTLAEKLSARWGIEWIVENETNRQTLLAAKRRVAQAKRKAGNDKAVAKAQRHLAAIKAQIFLRVKVEPGETPMEVIQRQAKKSQLMVWASADGKGIIASPRYDQPALYSLYQYPRTSPRRHLNNILNTRVMRSGRDRFSSYRVVGSFTDDGEKSHRLESEATDSEVTIERPLIITGSAKKLKEAQTEAQNEMQRRKFEGLVIELIVKRHTNNGQLWETDTLADLDDEVNGLSGPFYVTRRRFVAGEKGQRTELTLHEPGVLLP